MTEAITALQAGDLEKAMTAAKGAVRDAPGDVEARAQLFLLFCVSGDWDRAEAQLETLMTAGAEQHPIWAQFSMLLKLEARRREVYASGEVPTIVGEPEEWMTAFGKAFSMHQQGDIAGAQALRDQALSDAPAAAGSVGETSIEWIMDGDARLGPMLEAILPTEGDYVWIPFSRLGSFQIEKPTQINNLIWAPAHFTWTSGEVVHGFVPVRYIGTEGTQDAEMLQSRKTEWKEVAEGVFEGLGQKVLMSADDDFPILDIREARLEGHI